MRTLAKYTPILIASGHDMTHGMNRLSAFGFSSFKGIDCTIPSGYFAIIILLMNRVSEKQIDKNSGKNGELQR